MRKHREIRDLLWLFWRQTKYLKQRKTQILTKFFFDGVEQTSSHVDVLDVNRRGLLVGQRLLELLHLVGLDLVLALDLLGRVQAAAVDARVVDETHVADRSCDAFIAVHAFLRLVELVFVVIFVSIVAVRLFVQVL